MFHYSGLPIPRFVSLKNDTINVRVGPGKRYPIAWVYSKKHWPVEVFEEFGHWRHIRDHEGSEGWIHHSLLSGKRYGFVVETARPLYRAADTNSAVIAQINPEALGEIIGCDLIWCLMQFGEIEGWLRRDYVWGIYESEIIEK
ncbi:MAG: SH3 domain-containing protein [Rickettsiales bacterium]|nr:SH3 domain-containing protein [Rickettsiales bacterium]